MTALTVEQKRVKIAEACGWGGFENLAYPESLIGVPPQNDITEKALGPRKITNWTPRTQVPDYFGDLNACHEMEALVDTCEHRGKYLTHLERLCGDTGRQWPLVRATAPQRCEAIGLTLGLWEAGQ